MRWLNVSREERIEQMMFQLLAHVWWLEKGDPMYNGVKKLIMENEEKRLELMELLTGRLTDDKDYQMRTQFEIQEEMICMSEKKYYRGCKEAIFPSCFNRECEGCINDNKRNPNYKGGLRGDLYES